MILCRCTSGHVDHDFKAGDFALCTHCGHAVGAHKFARSPDAETLVRLVRRYPIEAWDLDHFPETNQMHLTIVMGVAA